MRPKTATQRQRKIACNLAKNPFSNGVDLADVHRGQVIMATDWEKQQQEFRRQADEQRAANVVNAITDLIEA
jgi:hypothetical protein